MLTLLLAAACLGAQASTEQDLDTVSLLQTVSLSKQRRRNDEILLRADEGTSCKGFVATVQGRGGGKFCLPSSRVNKPATTLVRSGQLHEPVTHSTIEKLANAATEKGDFVTMGLFFGDYLPHMSLLAGEDNRVWGFEPNPDNFALARGTIGLNQLKNCWIANVAGGKESGATLDFCIGEANGNTLGGQSHVLGSGENCAVTKVPVLTLDDVLPPSRRISLIHLDVEGQVSNVLRGARRTLQHWRPILVLELPGKEVENYLKQFGYKHMGHVEQQTVFMSFSKSISNSK